jgi:hypothetical protein
LGVAFIENTRAVSELGQVEVAAVIHFYKHRPLRDQEPVWAFAQKRRPNFTGR